MPNAENCTLAELDAAAKATCKKRCFVRLWSVRCLILGQPYDQVAKLSGISKRTLRSWIKRFNESGIDGLLDKPRNGRPRKIPREQDERLRELVTEPQLAGQTHWTARKFHGYLRSELQLEVGYSTVVRWLHEAGFRLKVPRPWPVEQDEEARAAYMERLRALLAEQQVELWYLDETGVEGDPRPRRRWGKSGAKSRLPHSGKHLRMSVTGMICPRTGEFYALEFSRSNSASLQAFLDHANADIVTQRRRNVIICDNASWHRNKSIKWGSFEPMFLPPYSPDFNPIERLWLIIKGEWFTDFIAADMDELIARLDRALLWAMSRRYGNRKTCAI